MKDAIDLYAILGIERKASPEEVRRAYKQRALETHPDKLETPCTQEQKEEAEQRFHRVYDAFEVLNDAEKRREYDKRTSSMTRAAFEAKWAARDAQSAARAAERQAWADAAAARHEERMRELRERSALARAAFMEQQRSRREDAQMVAQMLDALCRLDDPRKEAVRGTEGKAGTKTKTRTSKKGAHWANVKTASSSTTKRTGMSSRSPSDGVKLSRTASPISHMISTMLQEATAPPEPVLSEGREVITIAEDTST